MRRGLMILVLAAGTWGTTLAQNNYPILTNYSLITDEGTGIVPQLSAKFCLIDMTDFVTGRRFYVDDPTHKYCSSPSNAVQFYFAVNQKKNGDRVIETHARCVPCYPDPITGLCIDGFDDSRIGFANYDACISGADLSKGPVDLDCADAKDPEVGDVSPFDFKCSCPAGAITGQPCLTLCAGPIATKKLSAACALLNQARSESRYQPWECHCP